MDGVRQEKQESIFKCEVNELNSISEKPVILRYTYEMGHNISIYACRE